MIRIFVSVGIVGGLIVAYLTTFAVGPISQLPPPESLLTRFRAEGDVPENLNLALDETAEEMEVFEIPDADAEHLKVAQDAYDEMMSGMGMSGMNMGTDGGSMSADNGSMNVAGQEGGNMGTDGGGMNADNGSMNVAGQEGGDMGTDGGSVNADNGSMNMAGQEGGNAGMNMGGAEAMAKAEGGLMFSEDGPYDREITLSMSEWKFDKMKIGVKMGERIKFTVRNGGQIPHEFMFMSPPLMNAITYRSTRADWNLFEHEALYERALVLPGGEFTFVMQVQQAGAWMFMCMLPYHMEMGMMGQMATDGMAMDM